VIDRTRFIAIFAIAMIATGSVGFWQTTHAPAQQPAQQPANAPVPYVMGMGDLMNTLIQPRHAKLGLAGKAENWPLANYALSELRQAFAGITKAVPKFRGMPVGDLVDLALTQPLNAVEAAIKQQDAQKFAAAYDQLGQGCNACHMELDHPYVVIKTPDASAFPDQEFKAQR
jgi:hypothetical protein